MGTANRDAKVIKVGMSNPIKLKFIDLERELEVCPVVIKELNDDVNVGIEFFL